MKVTHVKTADLIPYVNNARVHSEQQVAQIAASIKEFGWTNPVLIDGDNGLIAGHGRLAAAQKLGMEKIPAIQMAGLSEAQKKALILADNKLALNATWDYDVLKLEVEHLKEMEFDIELTGFDESEFKTHEPNYDLLENENVDQEIDQMAAGVKKAIQIEFDIDDYDEAAEIIKFWRGQGADVGQMILTHLRAEKAKL